MQVLLCASVLCILYLRNLPKPSLINSQMYVFQHWTHYQPDHLNSFSYLQAFGCAGLFLQISQLTILDNEAESRLLNYILANPTVEHAVRLTLHAPTPPRPTHVRGFPFADLNRRFTPLLTSITIMKHKYGLVSKANPVIE
jgi:hypothetical protein